MNVGAAARGSVLVADDNERIRSVVRSALEHAGYQVHEAADGAAADLLVTRHQPDLVLLDVVMPYISGLDLLRHWHASHPAMAVIVLTGFGDEDSVGNALEAGADDYIAKPVQLRELVERVNAVLRRTLKGEPDVAEIVVGQIRLDLVGQRVLVGEREVLLSKTELALLRELMGAPDRVLPAEELLARVWGPEYQGDAEILRTNIYRLRRKLKGDSFLCSRPGVGYYIASQPEPEPPN